MKAYSEFHLGPLSAFERGMLDGDSAGRRMHLLGVPDLVLADIQSHPDPQNEWQAGYVLGAMPWQAGR